MMEYGKERTARIMENMLMEFECSHRGLLWFKYWSSGKT